MAMLDLLLHGRAMAEELPEEVGLHLDRAARHDVVERRHALEQRDVLERAGDAPRAASWGRIFGRFTPLKVMRPCSGGRSR